VDEAGDVLLALERKGQAWLDRAADAVDGSRDGVNEVPAEEVMKLMEEGRALPINLKDELEELGERCEVGARRHCVWGREPERDPSTRIRRHQAFALPPVRCHCH